MFLSDLPPSPVPAETIVVTASRAPEEQSDAVASVTVIGPGRTRRLGEPLAADLVRLAPSAALSVSGPAGSQSQLRIRGAEANHTLLFLDGIRANDPAAGNEPRLELLAAGLNDRVEVVRGPQSALWGSEAVGGVVALDAAPETGTDFMAEGGGRFARTALGGGLNQGRLTFGLAASLQGARGINAFAGGPGDADGYRNGTLRARADWRTGPFILTANGFAIRARSDFDGLDPMTFVRADTADESRNRLGAGRLGLSFDTGVWTARASGSSLWSRNLNLLGSTEQNRTSGRRDTLSLDLGRQFVTGALAHRLTLAAEWNREHFSASDTAFGGFTNQDRRRSQAALTAEWRGEVGPLVATLAIRRDRFSTFEDSTTRRAGALLRLGGGWQLAGSLGEGIAQPTFFDLFGFFPGSFVGNPALAPERSRGGELALRKAEGRWRGALTFHRHHLRDEIVERFDPVTFLASAENAEGRSRRKGIELEGSFHPSPLLNLSANFALLDSTEPAGRELRRPRRSGALVADGQSGRLSYGFSLTYSGTRLDRDFDLFPSRLVRLEPVLASNARLAWQATDRLELFARASNILDSEAQEVVGYRREGRTAYAGFRARLGR